MAMNRNWHGVFSKVSYLLVLGSVSLCSLAEPIALKTDTDLSKEGYFTLSWEEYNPQQAYLIVTSEGQPEQRYSLHKQTSITLTGFANGVYKLVVVDPLDKVVSNQVEVEVNHRSIERALMLLALGLVLFLVLLAVLFFGTRSKPNA